MSDSNSVRLTGRLAAPIGDSNRLLMTVQTERMEGGPRTDLIPVLVVSADRARLDGVAPGAQIHIVGSLARRFDAKTGRSSIVVAATTTRVFVGRVS